MIPDRISFDIGDGTVTVDVGELILPGLVLVVSALYYADTRGLPDKSLMYAEPVLYIAVGLAVVTIAQHAVSLGNGDERIPDGHGAGEVEADFHDATRGTTVESSSPYFNRRSAVALVALTLAYVSILTVQSAFVTDLTFVGVSTLYLGSVLFLFGERQWPRLLAYSLGFALLVWGVFVYWLRVPLV